MAYHAALSDREMAALLEADTPNACFAEPTALTAALVAHGLIMATPLGFYVPRAGRLRLASERSLRGELHRMPSSSIASSYAEDCRAPCALA